VRFRPIRALALSCAVASSLVLSACSSSGSSGGGAASTAPAAGSTASAAAATGTPIHIITTNSLDNPIANQPEGVAAEQAAVLAINKAGGINGHPIVLTVCNNSFNPNGSVACAREAATGSYVAVVGGWYIPGDVQAVPIETAAKIANIGMTAVAPIDATAPYWFPIDGGVFTGYPSVGSILKQYDPSVKSVVVMQDDNPNSTGAAALIDKGLTFAGLKLGGTVTVPDAATDLSSYAAKIQNLHPDAVAFATAPAQAVAMLKVMGQLGLDVPFVATAQDTPVPGVVAAGAIASKGLFFSYNMPQSDTSNPGVAQFLAELTAAHSSGVANTSPSLITAASFESWLAVHLFANVAKTISGPLTRASVLAAMEQAKDVNMYGIEPPYSAPPGPDPQLPRISADYVYTLKIVNGELQLASPNETPIHILQEGFRG
jgi:branched-chain amino acid transport system substrate-binding protein